MLFRSIGMWIFGGVGFLGSMLAFVFSFIPPDQISVGSPLLYVGILVVGAAVLIILPFIIYAMRKPHWRDPKTVFVPFTWQLEHKHPGMVNESKVSTVDLSEQWEDRPEGSPDPAAVADQAGTKPRAGTTDGSAPA